MKITFIKNDLVEAINNVSKAVAPTHTLPALEGILLVAENKKLTVTGYNLELGISAEINEVMISEPGSIVVSAKLFSNIIRKAADNKITIETEGYNVIVKSGKSKFKIVGIDSEEYPSLPLVDDKAQSIVIKGELLKNIASELAYAISDNTAKPIFTGALFEVSGAELKICTIDGFRMAHKKYSLDNNELTTSFVVPKKTLKEAVGIFSDDDEINVSVTQKHLSLSNNNCTVISRLIEGQFIDPNSVIPKEEITSFEISRSNILSAVERMAVLQKDVKDKAPIILDVTDKELTFSMSTTIGKANETLSVSIIGENLRIGFNVEYLIDVLKSIPDDTVTFKFAGTTKPMLVLPKTQEALHLVVPMRISK